MKPYDHKKIEKKWQKVWDENKVYQTLSAKKAKVKKLKPYYVLDMFPYPSGAGLHVGHPRGYIASDVFARMKRMQGYNVLHPMGFDSFGLPAEQYAIQTGKNPGPFTEQLVKRYRQQLSILGFSFDWDREVATHRPEFYRWTQWIFLQIYNSYYDLSQNRAAPIECLEKEFVKYGNTRIRAVCDADTPQFSKREWNTFSEIERQKILMKYRLAYEGYAEVNWCPEMGTVLANDEIVDGPNGPVSERGGFPVEKKQMRQWFMRITAYADRLIAGLETIDWPESIKEIQKNWIGKSEGAEIDFKIVLRNNTQTKKESLIQDISSLEQVLNPKNRDRKITVFTTRADTLFGVTYVVLAPEHSLVNELKSQISNWDEVVIYLDQVKNKSEIERTDAKKEKTGVCLEGVFAINPANGEQVPVWVADYVLANYGTGAVMAVPAHDERDAEFSYKYDLPIKYVIAPKIFQGANTFLRKGDIEFFQKRTSDDKLFPGKLGIWGGGRENDELPTDCIQRELKEELGLLPNQYVLCYWGIWKTFDQKNNPGTSCLFTADLVENTFDLKSFEGEVIEVKDRSLIENDFCEPLNSFLNENKLLRFCEDGTLLRSGNFTGLTSQEARKKITEFVGGKLVTKYKFRDAIFARQRYWGEPIPLVHKESPVKIFFLIESLKKGAHKKLEKLSVDVQKREDWGIYYFVEIDQLDIFIKKAQELLCEGPWYFDVSGNRKIICFKKKTFDLSTSGNNEKAIAYGKKIGISDDQLDWKFEEIKNETLIQEVPLKNLPLELPNVKSYAPAGNGESPLATVKSWVNAGYETNTMPGWAGSSWYFLRYTDPKNKKAIANGDELDYWFNKKQGGVDMYVGGAEHATGHLLYSRFWHKFLKDIGQVATEEPFKALRNQGMIGGTDGRKMSKRYGNVVNPDDVVAQFGADSLRVFEMFLGPFESHLPWSTDGIVGSRRFIEKVWRLAEKANPHPNPPQRGGDRTPSPLGRAGVGTRSYLKTLHKTIKKVTEDIASFSFNTAISSMMICANEMEKAESIDSEDFKKFLQILAPFAPHVTEDLWNSLGGKKSIHHAPWPQYDPNLIIDDSIKMGIQVNGKVRAEIELALDVTEADVKNMVLQIPDIMKWIDGKEIKKFIYIPKKIISIVV